jgi:hypothetical protein
MAFSSQTVKAWATPGSCSPTSLGSLPARHQRFFLIRPRMVGGRSGSSGGSAVLRRTSRASIQSVSSSPSGVLPADLDRLTGPGDRQREHVHVLSAGPPQSGDHEDSLSGRVTLPCGRVRAIRGTVGIGSPSS